MPGLIDDNHVKFSLYFHPHHALAFYKSHESWNQHWEYRGVTPKWLSFHHSAEWDLKVEIKFNWEIRDESYISSKLAVWTETQTQMPVIFWYSTPRYGTNCYSFYPVWKAF